MYVIIININFKLWNFIALIYRQYCIWSLHWENWGKGGGLVTCRKKLIYNLYSVLLDYIITILTLYFKESFEVCKVLDSQNVYCWYTYINDMVPKDMIEMDKLSSCKTKKDIKSLKPVLKSELKNHYIKLSNLYIECLTEQNKLFLYKHLKLNDERKFYLSHPNFEFRKLITIFRICYPYLTSGS